MRLKHVVAVGVAMVLPFLQGGGRFDADGREQAEPQIVFASNRDGNWEIYVMNVDGSGLKNLTNNGADDREPAFSPDGSKIVFTSDRDGMDVFVMYVDGSGQKNLTDKIIGRKYYPTFSPDGSKIMFTSNRNGFREIYLVNVDGSGLEQLTNRPAGAPGFDYEVRYPVFSPDGKKIAFACNPEHQFNYEIYIMNADGTGVDQMTVTEYKYFNWSPAFSPDSKKIVFMSTRDGRPAIYVMNADGRRVKRLTDDTVRAEDPTFSPDGKKIVYSGSQGGNLDIFVMNADGKGVTRLTTNAAADLEPSFSLRQK